MLHWLQGRTRGTSHVAVSTTRHKLEHEQISAQIAVMEALHEHPGAIVRHDLHARIGIHNVMIDQVVVSPIYMSESEDAMQLQPISAIPFQRALTEISDVEAAVLARATVNLFNDWTLMDAQACTLLGGLSVRTWGRWKEGKAGRVHRDLKMRMAYLMGIHKGLRYLFKDVGRRTI